MKEHPLKFTPPEPMSEPPPMPNPPRGGLTMLTREQILADPPRAADKTVESLYFYAGAQAEAELRTQGITPSGRQIYDAVETLAQQGHSQDEIAEWVTLVFGPGLSKPQRRRLAWRLLRGYRRTRKRTPHPWGLW